MEIRKTIRNAAVATALVVSGTKVTEDLIQGNVGAAVVDTAEVAALAIPEVGAGITAGTALTKLAFADGTRNDPIKTAAEETLGITAIVIAATSKRR